MNRLKRAVMRSSRILILLILLIGFLVLSEYYGLNGALKRGDIQSPERGTLTGSLKIVQKSKSDLDAGLPDKLNRSPLETIRCEVFSVDKVPLLRENTEVLNLMVETDEEILPVYLAPVWVFEERGFYIRPKDFLTLSGFRAAVSGYDTFVTTTIRKGDRVLTLRNSQGIPVWDTLQALNALNEDEQ